MSAGDGTRKWPVECALCLGAALNEYSPGHWCNAHIVLLPFSVSLVSTVSLRWSRAHRARESPQLTAVNRFVGTARNDHQQLKSKLAHCKGERGKDREKERESDQQNDLPIQSSAHSNEKSSIFEGGSAQKKKSSSSQRQAVW